MQIFARQQLVIEGPDRGRPRLLLEGSWPAVDTSRPDGSFDLDASRDEDWSLDEAIDARHVWIDEQAAACEARIERGAAANLAGPVGPSALSFAYVNALSLRYYLVKLLRVIAFFDEVRRPTKGEPLDLYLARGRDEDYADLFEQLAQVHGINVRVSWRDASGEHPPPATPERWWRRLATHASNKPSRHFEQAKSSPRVLLCGSPRILDPVCAELLTRGTRLWWLYDRFAARSWLRWRKAGVRQWVCETARGERDRFSDGWPGGIVACRGVDLSAPVERWLNRRAAELGGRQSHWLARVDECFRQVRPALVVLDEDATGFHRAVVAIAREHGAASCVVQHGAPCVRFGFAPLAADAFCAWDTATRDQLIAWGVGVERIEVTGSPGIENHVRRLRAALAGCRQPPSPTVLLLATVPPRDSRPDSVTFHLTQATHDEMLRTACSAVSKIPKARLVIKLHPRASDDAAFRRAIAEFPDLQATIVRSGKLEQLLAESSCVLSCASTAGIESARAGARVIQLLPRGSGDVLPAERWNLLGTARTQSELDLLVAAALSKESQEHGAGQGNMEQQDSQTQSRAAARLADFLLEQVRHGASRRAVPDPAIAP